jgi:hypothetical protein
MTVAFKTSANAWVSTYSFDTSCFAFVDNTMLSFNTEVVEDNPTVHRHDVAANKNSFYGVVNDSSFTVSVNDNPSKNKIYKAVSLEGANLRDATSSFVANLSPQFNQAREGQVFEGFVEKGGIFYGGLTKSNLTDPTNNLKAVGQINRARLLTLQVDDVDTINAGTFPFRGYTLDDYLDYLFFELSPYPHFKQLDSASSNQEISKYFIGVLENEGISIKPLLVDASLNDVGNIDGDIFFQEGSIDGRNTTFAEQPDTLVNTSGVSRYNSTVVVRVKDSVLNSNASGLPDEAVNNTSTVRAVNKYLNNGGVLILFKITDDRIDGTDPRGQYGDLTITIPPVDFEIFAVNMDYEPTELDHSKG